MNPSSKDPNFKLPDDNTQNLDPITYVPEDSSPEADIEALRAIGALEAEEDTIRTVTPPQAVIPEEVEETPPVASDAPQVVDVMTPFVSAEPTVSAEEAIVESTELDTKEEPSILPIEPIAPIVPLGSSNIMQDAPVQTNVNPFAKKKSSKKMIIILIAAIVLIGGSIAGYFVWQSMQSDDSEEATQSITGDQPGGTVKTDTTDTESSINNTANALEKDADAVDDSAYADSVLADTTLYDN